MADAQRYFEANCISKDNRSALLRHRPAVSASFGCNVTSDYLHFHFFRLFVACSSSEWRTPKRLLSQGMLHWHRPVAAPETYYPV